MLKRCLHATIRKRRVRRALHVVTTLRRTTYIVAAAFAVALTNYSHATTREIVEFSGFAPNTIIVKTNERHLYYTIDDSHALRFPVGVGRAGMAWTGKARIEGKYLRPAWAAPQADGPGEHQGFLGAHDGNAGPHTRRRFPP